MSKPILSYVQSGPYYNSTEASKLFSRCTLYNNATGVDRCREAARLHSVTIYTQTCILSLSFVDALAVDEKYQRWFLRRVFYTCIVFPVIDNCDEERSFQLCHRKKVLGDKPGQEEWCIGVHSSEPLVSLFRTQALSLHHLQLLQNLESGCKARPLELCQLLIAPSAFIDISRSLSRRRFLDMG
jgi:hypothetical protein